MTTNSDKWAGSVYSLEVLDKGLQDGAIFCYTTQNGMEFNICELFVSGTFRLIFRLLLTEGN